MDLTVVDISRISSVSETSLSIPTRNYDLSITVALNATRTWYAVNTVDLGFQTFLYLVLILVLTPFIIWYKQHVSFFLKCIFISSYLLVYLINIMHMFQPWSGHGSGVLLLRKRSHILAIHNLRLSLGLTLTRETDLRGPDRNLTRRPFPLTWPLESFKPWQGEPLALGGLPPAPHLHPNTLPPITSQHPPTIWKDKSMQSDICLNSIHKTTCTIGKLST